MQVKNSWFSRRVAGTGAVKKTAPGINVDRCEVF